MVVSVKLLIYMLSTRLFSSKNFFSFYIWKKIIFVGVFRSFRLDSREGNSIDSRVIFCIEIQYN